MPNPNTLKFPKVAIRNQVSTGVLELHFLDEIYDTYDWWTGDSTNLVAEVVEKVKNAKPTVIMMTIDSQGGDAGIGLAIYNFLKNYRAEKEVDIIGMAGSIASVLAMAASKGKLRIARNAFMVIHQAWGWGAGNSSDLRAQADVIDKYTEQVVDVYTQRTEMSSEEVNNLIADGDHWMTGREAIESGFADELMEENTNFQIAARIKGLDGNYKNVPQNLIAPSQDTDETTTDEPTTKPAASSAGNEVDQEEATTITQTVQKAVMNLKEKFGKIVNDIKGKKINKDASNLAEEVANLLADPIGDMATALQEDVQNELNTIQENVTNAVTQAFETRLTALETANASLLKENADLKEEAANNKGGETGAKNDLGGVQPWGEFVTEK